MNLLLQLLFIGLQVIDLWTTTICLRRGYGVENNPLAKFHVRHLYLTLLLRGLAILAFVSGSLVQPVWFVTAVRALIAAPFIYSAWNNISIIRRLSK